MAGLQAAATRKQIFSVKKSRAAAIKSGSEIASAQKVSTRKLESATALRIHLLGLREEMAAVDQADLAAELAEKADAKKEQTVTTETRLG